MQALHWDGKSLRRQTGHPNPTIQNGMHGFAVVRVRLAGICSTDLQIFKGYMAFAGVPGHEFVGEVREGPADLLGKRVVGEINFSCGTCKMCQNGLQRHCPTRQVMGILNADGSFAEYMAVPVANLHVVADNISDEEAVFAEPLAAAFEMLEQVEVLSNAAVVVFGDGKLGLLCAQVLHQIGARVTVVGKHPDKLGFLNGVGIRKCLLVDWKPSEADLVVEATGSKAGLALAMQTVRPRGTLVLKSTVAAEHCLSLAPLVVNEVTVVGSRCGVFAPALEALAYQRVSVLPLINKVYPLEEGIAAVNHASRAGTLKILLKN